MSQPGRRTLHSELLHSVKFRSPGFGGADRGTHERCWQSSWPHDLRECEAGCVRHPFPDAPFALVVLWQLGDVEEEIHVVPASHRDGRNPAAATDGLNAFAPIPDETTVRLRPNSCLILDSRLWWSARSNADEKVRCIGTLAPWWLWCDYGSRLRANLSEERWSTLPEPLQMLTRHRAEGVVRPHRPPLALSQTDSDCGLRANSRTCCSRPSRLKRIARSSAVTSSAPSSDHEGIDATTTGCGWRPTRRHSPKVATILSLEAWARPWRNTMRSLRRV